MTDLTPLLDAEQLVELGPGVVDAAGVLRAPVPPPPTPIDQEVTQDV